MKTIFFGKWHPFNPFPLPIGTPLLNYVFRKKEHDEIPIEWIKRTLDEKGFRHPIFYRTNNISKEKYIEYMCIYPKQT